MVRWFDWSLPETQIWDGFLIFGFFGGGPIPPKPIFTDDGKTIVVHFSCNTNDQHVDLYLHRYAPPIKDMGVPEAAQYSCAPYAKVSAPLCHCCMRNHKPKQSACVRDDERGPLTRCDTERARTNQSLQHRRDMRPRYALKCLCG